MIPNVELYLRGRLVRLSGWMEPADPAVGIYHASFCAEIIELLDEGPAPIWLNRYEDYDFSNIFDTLDDGDWREIHLAFLESQPLEDSELVVFEWGWDAEAALDHMILDHGFDHGSDFDED